MSLFQAAGHTRALLAQSEAVGKKPEREMGKKPGNFKHDDSGEDEIITLYLQHRLNMLDKGREFGWVSFTPARRPLFGPEVQNMLNKTLAPLSALTAMLPAQSF
jgi:hypothetical protein